MTEPVVRVYRDRVITGAEQRQIADALEAAPQYCCYHGQDFERMGMSWGEPRCDACKLAWRVTQALAALRGAS